MKPEKPIVISVIETIRKGLVKEVEDLEIKGQVETIQTTALLTSESWEESWRLKETCYHSNYREKLSANSRMKNTQGNKINIQLRTVITSQAFPSNTNNFPTGLFSKYRVPHQKKKKRTHIFLTEIHKFNSTLFFFSGYEVDSLHEKLGP